MKYKMVVLDVDGTLLTNEKTVTARTRATLIRVQQMGIKVVLASGRPTYGVVGLAKELELDKNGGYILSYNGGQIINVQTNELLFEKRIDPGFIPYLERKAQKNGFAIFTYREDEMLTNDASNERVLQEARLNGMQLRETDRFSEEVSFHPWKVMLSSDDEKALVGLEEHWKKRLAGTLDVFRSETYFLEVVPQFIDKANTLSVLLEKLNIPSADIGYPGGEVGLVGALDLRQAVQDGVVGGVGVVGQDGQVLDPGVGAGDLVQQGRQARVALAQPAARGDAVGLVVEALGPDGVPVLEGVALEDLGVQGGDAVDCVKGITGDPGHADLGARDRRHVVDSLDRKSVV